MYTLEQATDFVNGVVSMWEKGEMSALADVYTQDVEGHFNDESFGYQDIVDRMTQFNRYTRDRRFSLTKVVVVDTLIIGTMRQVWLRPSDDALCEAMVTFIYRMRDDLVKELWIIVDQAQESYTDSSNDMEKNHDQFSVGLRKKSDFLLQMSDRLYFRAKQSPVKLSSIETECLFYYLNGYTSKEVAQCMEVSHRTVESYINNIKMKFHCSTRGELRLALFPDKG